MYEFWGNLGAVALFVSAGSLAFFVIFGIVMLALEWVNGWAPAAAFYGSLALFITAGLVCVVSLLGLSSMELESVQNRYGVRFNSVPGGEPTAITVGDKPMICKSEGAYPDVRVLCGDDFKELPLKGALR